MTDLDSTPDPQVPEPPPTRHVQEAWQDAALAKRWSKLSTKLDKLAQTIDDPY